MWFNGNLIGLYWRYFHFCLDFISSRQQLSSFFSYSQLWHKCYRHQPETLWIKRNYKIIWDFNTWTNPSIRTKRRDLANKKKKKWTCQIRNWNEPVDHVVNVEGIEKFEKYQDHTREFRKIRNMKIDVLETVPKAMVYCNVSSNIIKNYKKYKELEVEI